MKLQDVRNEYYAHTGSVSTVSRQLVLAGIALIWIFRTTLPNGEARLPRLLIFPSVLLIVALAGDLLQYAIAAWNWHAFFEDLENSGMAEERDVEAPASINTWPKCFFVLKIACTFAAYGFLLAFAAQHLF